MHQSLYCNMHAVLYIYMTVYKQLIIIVDRFSTVGCIQALY